MKNYKKGMQFLLVMFRNISNLFCPQKGELELNNSTISEQNI